MRLQAEKQVIYKTGWPQARAFFTAIFNAKRHWNNSSRVQRQKIKMRINLATSGWKIGQMSLFEGRMANLKE